MDTLTDHASASPPQHILPAAIDIGSLRLRTLIRLRWLAVAGQLAAVLTVNLGLAYPLPLSWCLAAIALSAWLNIYLAIRWRKVLRLTPAQAGVLLAYDILQLAALLYLTGGLENPFAFLFLVPVTISATSLPLRWTLWLALIAFSCATFLAIDHFPLPWEPGAQLTLPRTYIAGMWAAIMCGVIFAAIYARRIGEEARQMSQALAATEMVLAREQQFSALDGLAAAAAHELGTPLATIALVAREMKRAMKADDPHAEDIDLLISQSRRCRDILAKLANRESANDEMFARTTLSAMIEDLVAPLRGSEIEIAVSVSGEDGSAEPVLRRNPGIAYGLGNLLENATDFAHGRVDVTARWTADTLSIVVSDDGPGFREDVFDRLGDPFVTTRPGYEQTGAAAEGHEGMGLGFFIAKTLLERSGASVALSNRTEPDSGAVVRVIWPRASIDVRMP